jgi:beta-lactamase class A
MIPTTLPPNITQGVQPAEFSPSPNQVAEFDRPETKEVIKQFLLRQFVKKEIRENEQLNILTDVTLYDMQTGRTILGHNESTPHFAASINKLPVTLLLLRNLQANAVTLDTTVTWQESDRRAGNGIYDQPGVYQATVGQVLHDLLNRSGNTAVRILVNGVLGGPYAVNERLAQIPELEHTRLIPLDSNRFYLGNTTSKEALFVLRELMAEDASYTRIIRQFLATNIFVNDGVRSQLAGNDYILLVNKTGLLYDPDGNNHHDVGIIYNQKTGKSYGYSFLNTAPSGSAEADTRAQQSTKDMGKYTLRFSGDKPVQGSSQQQPQTLRQEQLVPETKMIY